MFSVRIVTTDHYLSAPIPGLDVQYADLRGSEVKKVPVVRIFGATPAGQKTCMHVHGVFPYLYVPYDGTAPWDRYLRQFATSLDKAVNVAQGHGQSDLQHVYKIVLVSGTAMYGFHDKEQQFLKIYMYNPKMIRKAADLLLGGAVLNKPFQPHESHIPYTLQMFIDYNLYGMNMINSAAVKFRRKLSNDNDDGIESGSQGASSQGSYEGFGLDPRTPGSFTGLLNRSGSMTPSRRLWDHENIHSDLYLDRDVERQSTCYLEVDIVAADILNRLEVNATVGGNPGLTALWEDERQRCRDRGEGTDITPPRSPEREDIDVADSETILRDRLQQIILDLQPYMDSQSDSESEASQGDDLPSTQASAVDLHLSQDMLSASQDTVMLDVDDEEEAVVNLESIQHVVTHSQSFCETKPRLSSQDKSLVDILAALANDTPTKSSQDAVVDALMLEDHDSVLSQTSQPQNTEMDEEDEAEELEMSQRVGDAEDVCDEDKDKVDAHYDMTGMDDTWGDSQLQTAVPSSDDDDDDSDANSDIIPQYDGPIDEKTQGDLKQHIAKRLGMRGPVFSMTGRGNSCQNHMSGYGVHGNMAPQYNPQYGRDYRGGPGQMSQQQFSPGAQPDWSQKQALWGAGGGMYPSHHSTLQQSPNSIRQSPSKIPLSGSISASHLQQLPDNMSSGHLQQLPGNMSPGHLQQLPGNMSPGRMQQLPGNMSPGSMHHSPGSMQQSPTMLSPYGSQNAQQIPPFSATGNPVNYSSYIDSQYKGNQPGQSMSDIYSVGTASRQPGFNQNQQTYSGQQLYRIQHSSSHLEMDSHKHMPKSPSRNNASGVNMFGERPQPPRVQCQQQSPRQPTSGQKKALHHYSASPQMTSSSFTPSSEGYMMPSPDTAAYVVRRPSSETRRMSNSMSRSSSLSEESFGLNTLGGLLPTSPSQDSDLLSPSTPVSETPVPSGQLKTAVPPSSGYHLKRPGGMVPMGDYTNIDNHSLLHPPAKQSRQSQRPQDLYISQQQVSQRMASPVLSPSPNMYRVQRTSQHLNASNFAQSSAQNSAQSSVSTPHNLTELDSPNSAVDFLVNTFHKPASAKIGQQNHKLTDKPISVVTSESKDTSSKQSEQPMMGPISRFYAQKKLLMYEQISPPATPVGDVDKVNKRLMSPSPSSNLSDPQMSPLQKLLLEPCTSPPQTKPELTPLQRSLSRSSLSSLSPVNSEKVSEKQKHSSLESLLLRSSGDESRKDPNLTSPAVSQDSSADSKLYSLLAAKSQSDGQVLNDSQQDLFADSILTSNNEENLSNVSIFSDGNRVNRVESNASDTLASLLDESFETQESSNKQMSLQTEANQLFNSIGGNKTLDKSDSFASLSSLENFVGSVQKDNTDYGVNFAKTETANKGPSQQTSFLSQLNDLDNFDTQPFQQLQQQHQQQQQQHQQQHHNDYNFSNWPQYASPMSKTSSQIPGLVPKKRGRPSLKKSVSVPGQPIAEKRKRGRPRKNSASPASMGSSGSSPRAMLSPSGQQFQQSGQQYQQFSSQNSFMSNDSMQQQYMSNQQNFQQLLQEPTNQGQMNQGQSYPVSMDHGQSLVGHMNQRESQMNPVRSHIGHPGLTQLSGQLNRGQSQMSHGKLAQGQSKMNQQHTGQMNQDHSQMPINRGLEQLTNEINEGQSRINQGLEQLSGQINPAQLQTNMGQEQGQMNQGQALLSDQTHQGLDQMSGQLNQVQSFADELDQDQSLMGLIDEGQSHTNQMGGGQSFSNQLNQGQTNPLHMIEPLDDQSSFSSYGISEQNQHSTAHGMQQQGSQQFIPSQQYQSDQQYPTNRGFQQQFNNPANQQYQQDGSFFNQSVDMQHAQTTDAFFTNYNTEVDNVMSTIDASQLAQDPETSQQQQQFYKLNSQSTASCTNQPQIHSAVTNPAADHQTEKDFRLITLQSMAHQDTLVQSKHKAARPMEKSSITELIRYRVRPPPKPSPAYTYRFKVPTPVYKRLKFRLKRDDSSNDHIDFVRMHPKDARKYSLLKIGREVVRLKNLSFEKIAKLKEDLEAGVNVEAIPSALRMVDVANIPVQTSIISDLLSCDSPTNDKTMESDSALAMQQEDSITMTHSHYQQFPLIHKGNNILVKKQRKNSDLKEKKHKSMFDSKNISNIPHLKKYRAGFSYFGKGNVGKATNVKVRQRHPVLGPDYEDDEDIVLRDVSLTEATDGTLTPIKSRTPVAGRSPAHSGGQIAEIESQDKEFLDTKLKSLEYELDLNQSNNSQMFQEDLFVPKESENTEYGSTTEEETDDDHMNEENDVNKDNKKEDIESEVDKNEDNDNEEDENTDDISDSIYKITKCDNVCVKVECDSLDSTSDLLDGTKISDAASQENMTDEVDHIGDEDRSDRYKHDSINVDEIETPVRQFELDTNCEKSVLNDLIKKEPDESGDNGENVNSTYKKQQENKEMFKKVVNCETSVDPITNQMYRPNNNNENFEDGFSDITGSEKDNIHSTVDNLIENIHANNAGVFFGKFKKHFEQKVVRQNASIDEKSEKYVECLDLKHLKSVSVRLSRSRSSSCESRSVSNKPESRRSSIVKTADSILINKALSSSYINSKRQVSSDSSDNKTESKRRKRTSYSANSSIAGSRRSSYSSSTENEYKRSKSKKKEKKKSYRTDSDSDGIPGVDYIVTGKFKGHKEMKVILNKVKLDNSRECVNVNEFMNICNEVEKDGFYKKVKSRLKKRTKRHNSGNGDLKVKKVNPSKPVSGYSAEFEKFLLATSQPTSEPYDDEPHGKPAFLDNCKMDGSEISELEHFKANCENDIGEVMSEEDLIEQETEELNEQETDSEETNAKKMQCKQRPLGGTVLHECRQPDGTFKYECMQPDGTMSHEHQQPDGTTVAVLPQEDNVGLKDFSSTSDDESDERHKCKKQKTVDNNRNKADIKKRRGSTIHDRMGRAFCGKKTRRKRQRTRQNAKPSKLMSTLSVLHDATMEKLTCSQSFNNISNSTNRSPLKIRDLSEIDSPIKTVSRLDLGSQVTVDGAIVVNSRMKSPDFELYADKTDDHEKGFDDAMYKLAYYSPPLSDNGNSSPPQPLSPEELKSSDCEKLVEHKEQKLTLADIVKSVNNSNNPMLGEQFYETPASSVETVKSKENSPKSAFDIDGHNFSKTESSTIKYSPVKTAVAKVAQLTLKDIKSFCEEENALKMTSSDHTSPPDLGPPVIQKYSPRKDISRSSPSPPLSLNKHSLASETKLDTERSNLDGAESPSEDKNRSVPPFLTPCQSPRVPLSPRAAQSPQVVSDNKGETRGGGSYFNLSFESETKLKSGRSPGASSAGSINVIHSEQFSDISDESDDDLDYCATLSLSVGNTSPRLPLQNCNNESISGTNASSEACNKERKLKEIKEFEERHKHSDENKNSIFKLLTFKHEAKSLNKILNLEPKENSNFHRSDNHRNFVQVNNPFSSTELHVGKTSNSSDTGFVEKSEFETMEDSIDMKVSLDHCSSPCLVNSNGKVNLHDHFMKSQVSSGLDFSKNRSLSLPNEELEFKRNTMDHSLSNGKVYPDLRNLRNTSFSSSFPFTQQNSLLNVNTAGSQRNFFDNFSLSHEKLSRHFEMGANSGDLFESYSGLSDSSNHSNHSDRSQHSFSRSRSDLHAKPDYSIVRNSKLSNSIIRSVANRINARQKINCDSVIQMNNHLPVTEFGTGEGKSKANMKKSNQGQSSRSNIQSSGLGSSGLSGGQGDISDYYDNTPKGHDHTKHGSHDNSEGNQVITPLTPPPTRESIHHSANQYGLPSVQVTGAFFSNHGDALDKPREGGAQVLKVPSTLVKNLEEFDTSSSSSSTLSSSITGLTNWRAIICTDNPVLSSQPNTDTIQDKLEKEPALKYALTGDQAVLITPCTGPPSRTKVEKWFRGRKLYKNLKNKAIQEKEQYKKTENENRNVTERANVNPDALRLNLFTGRREVTNDTNNEAETANYNDVIPDKTSADSEEKDDPTDENVAEKTNTVDDQSLLHSTPVTRRDSTDLFEPHCTPITGDGTDKVEDKDEPSFVTPKRIRPLRRLSTNTETKLRRAILSSQVKQQFSSPVTHKADVSQIEGPTPKNSFGFKVSQQNFQDAKALHEYQHLTVLSVEVHVETRGDLRPDPEFDVIHAIFYSIFNDVPADQGMRNKTGVFIIDPASANQQQTDELITQMSGDPRPGTSKGSTKRKRFQDTLLQKSGTLDLSVVYVKDELDLLKHFKEFILRWDPDILVGYEIQMLSWGYILQRASTLSMNLTQEISRVPSSKNSSHHSAAKDEFGADYSSEIHIAGRVVLNLWRLVKHEVSLNIYSFENVAFHVLHRRIPLFSFKNLTFWYKHRTHLHRWKVLQHYTTRVKGTLEMMDQLDLVGRTSEFARVFGIEFYHVLSRGSQYRVESMMLRVAKPMNYIPVSPSVHQRARMKAPECIALTLEPKSRFYTDPVIVLDFQSLYPSIMIAYNYCFSTCLGRLEWFQKTHEGPIDFGCTSLNLSPSVIKKTEKDVTISPNGIVFCKQSVKRGVLPIMVEEILNTRLMVKKAMSSYKNDKTLTRMLHARQLGLKLIANVTYGYTAANFSGRMPCIEVGDSIVRKARETLERSIKLVEDTPKWGAKVVYGDTDSMFLLLKGRSKDEAFKIGQEIANAVTAMFPQPIKLKFEKVYLPCVLQTKKRYVGFMYETPGQKEPVYDAKGIETVRRDSCSVVSKMLECSIKILFTSHDVSQVKRYIQQQCQKVMEGTVSLQDFVFAKEYRGMPGYKAGACVPALEIAKKLIRQDRCAEPRVGERVPYVIVYGSPGLPLIQLVRQPAEVLHDASLRLNSTYYITKQILPPLDRFLSLLGVDVFSWYQEMPHTAGRAVTHSLGPEQVKKGTISQYFATSNCPLCETQTKQPLCGNCMKDPQLVCATLNDRITRWETVHRRVLQICGTCTGCMETSTAEACISQDCPILYRVSRANNDLNKAQVYRDILAKVFK